LGSNGSVVPLFRKQIEKGGPITVTDRRITRFFMTIPEACSLVLEAGSIGEGGDIFVFDMGEKVKIWDLAEKMRKLAHRPDIEIVETGLRPGEKLYEEVLANEENTIKTDNEKIMHAIVRKYEASDVDAMLVDLHEALETCDPMKIVAQMKVIVPEFKSNNSIFSQLDK
jgi:FlaA1/EpsC-like NDP-sugar epimerase